MQRRKPMRTKQLVLAIGVLVALLLVANGAYNVRSARGEAIEAALRGTMNLARVLDAQTGAALEAARSNVSLLATIASAPDSRSQALLDRVLASLPPSPGRFAGALTVLDSDGTVIHSSDRALLGYNFADRPYFQLHREGARGIALSDVLTNRATGHPAVIISDRVEGADGRFLGIACAVVDLRYVESVFGSINIGHTGSVSLVRTNGQVLARWPTLTRLPENVTGGPLLTQHLPQSESGTYTATGFDGIERMFAYRRIPDSPLVISVGLATHEVLSGWRSRAAGQALATGAFVVLTVWLMALVLRALARQAEGERALRARQARLSTAQELARLGSWTIGVPSGETLANARAHWSREMAQIFGRGPRETRLSFNEALAHVHPDDRQRAVDTLENAMSHGGTPGGEFRIIGADGKIRDVAINGTVEHHPDGHTTMTGFIQDISERKRSQNELERVRRQLIALSRRLFEVQEEERRSLSRELHDEVGQVLTLLVMELRTATAAETPDQAHIASCVDLAREALAQVRDISFTLRPALLDELGLEPALQWLLQRVAAAAGFAGVYKCEPDVGRCDPNVELACFRIAQEALTNVSKHADAQLVEVRLRRTADRIELRVSDDGRGFDTSATAATSCGVGLISMRERAQLVGGSLTIESGEGGTSLTALLPLPSIVVTAAEAVTSAS